MTNLDMKLDLKILLKILIRQLLNFTLINLFQFLQQEFMTKNQNHLAKKLIQYTQLILGAS